MAVQSQHYSQNISLFTKYTGIAFRWIPLSTANYKILYCEYCPFECKMKNNCLHSLSNVSLTYFCQNGYCYLSAPIVSEHKVIGYYLSEPVYYRDDRLNHSMSLCRISMASRLLFELTVNKRTLFPTDTLIKQLSCCVSDSQSEKAQSIFEHLIEELFLAAEGDFHRVKSYTTRFILMLYEIMDENSECVKSQKAERFPGYTLSSAETLGELKSILDAVCRDFMLQMFPASLYKHHVLLQKAAAIIKENYHRKLTQNSVAGSVYLSPSYFSKVFKDAFGCTFNQYLNNVRITKAKELLRYSTVLIDSIPGMVGFENRSYFGKIFKQITGLTPKQYRNSSVK